MTNEPNAKKESEIVYETVRGAVTGDDAPMESEHKVATAGASGRDLSDRTHHGPTSWG